MRQDKPGDHERVIPEGMELGVRKGEDNRQDRRTDVAQEDRPEARDIPVLAAAYDGIEVPSELIAL